MTTAFDVRVRNASNTYTAKLLNRHLVPGPVLPPTSASCTAGPEHAAGALARKVFGDRPATLQFVSRDGRDEIWRITA